MLILIYIYINNISNIKDIDNINEMFFDIVNIFIMMIFIWFWCLGVEKINNNNNNDNNNNNKLYKLF